MSEQLTASILIEWKRHAEYICRDSALTNAKNQALRVLALLEEVDRCWERIEQLEDW